MNKELKHIKTTGFKTPIKYFSSIEDNVMDSIKLENIINSDKVTGFEIPNDYFNSVEKQILNTTTEKENKTKVISLFSRQSFWYASSVAAAIIIMFAIFYPKSPNFDNLKVETVENYIFQETYTSDDLAILFSSEELDELTMTENIYSEESLENYLLENTSVEDLIIE